MRNDWSRTLSAALDVREKQYESAPADDSPERTEYTAFALVAVLSHLEELPEFRSGRGILPLKCLASSLFDLRQGREPTLLQRSPSRFRPDRKERRDLKFSCAVGVRALIATGEKATAACAVVAKEMAKQGFGGRQGGELVWRTVYDWYRVSLVDAETDQNIKGFLSDWAADTSNVMTHSSVLEWVRRQARKSAFRSSSMLIR